MNSKQLRHSLRTKWLTYYRDNREWIDRLGIWITAEGERRPSSGFIIATLAILEPNLNQLLPLVVELSSNPDRIVKALGLDISPDKALKNLTVKQRMLPGGERPDLPIPEAAASQSTVEAKAALPPNIQDEACQGRDRQAGKRPR